MAVEQFGNPPMYGLHNKQEWLLHAVLTRSFHTAHACFVCIMDEYEPLLITKDRVL